MIDQCESCKWFQPQTPDVGFCHRYPPTVFIAEGNVGFRSVFTPVQHIEYCGEHDRVLVIHAARAV